MTTLEQNQIVTITPAAVSAVRDLLKEKNLEDGYSLRVFVTGQSCSGLQYGMSLENNPTETDSTFVNDGFKVYIDQESLQFMSGAIIDFVNDERGKGFLIENPNYSPSCSCDGGSCGCE